MTYLDPVGSQVTFDATPTDERDGPDGFLRDFRGHLQADAYEALYRSGRIVEVGCWAHGQRRFAEALETDVRAAPLVASIRQLYQVERDAAELDFEGRRGLPQQRSIPLLAQVDEQRQALQKTVLPKSPLGEALRYLDNQWTALNRFVEDGRLSIDNNLCNAACPIMPRGLDLAADPDDFSRERSLRRGIIRVVSSLRPSRRTRRRHMERVAGEDAALPAPPAPPAAQLDSFLDHLRAAGYAPPAVASRRFDRHVFRPMGPGGVCRSTRFHRRACRCVSEASTA